MMIITDDLLVICSFVIFFSHRFLSSCVTCTNPSDIISNIGYDYIKRPEPVKSPLPSSPSTYLLPQQDPKWINASLPIPLFYEEYRENFCQTSLETAGHMVCCKKICYESVLKRVVTTYHINCNTTAYTNQYSKSYMNNYTNNNASTPKLSRYDLQYALQVSQCTNSNMNERKFLDKEAEKELNENQEQMPRALSRIYNWNLWFLKMMISWMAGKFFGYFFNQLLFPAIFGAPI